MAESVTLEEYKRAYREIVASEERTGFYVHLTAYALVNAVLIAVNLYFVPFFLWFFIPLGAWGVGVIYHYLSCVRFASRDLEKKEAQAEYRARGHGTPLSR